MTNKTDKIFDYMRENNICIFHIYRIGIRGSVVKVRCTWIQFYNHVRKFLPQDKFYTRIIHAGVIKGVHMYRVEFYRYGNHNILVQI